MFAQDLTVGGKCSKEISRLCVKKESNATFIVTATDQRVKLKDDLDEVERAEAVLSKELRGPPARQLTETKSSNVMHGKSEKHCYLQTLCAMKRSEAKRA